MKRAKEGSSKGESEGVKLKEIGAAYGVGESAVTQASRSVAEEMERNESLRKSVEILVTGLGVWKV